MRKAIILVSMLILSNATSLSAKQIKIDKYVKGTSGCIYHIVGWIDYSLFPPQIDCYDITVTSTCGLQEHFVEGCK